MKQWLMTQAGSSALDPAVQEISFPIQVMLAPLAGLSILMLLRLLGLPWILALVGGVGAGAGAVLLVPKLLLSMTPGGAGPAPSKW